MMKYPTVSIIVCCYNQAKYVENCLTRIEMLDYQNIELIIIDDCSNDRSLELVSRHQSKYPMTIIANEANMGLCASLNRALKQASGKYVKLIAADDSFPSGSITTFVNYLEEHPNIDILYGDVFVMNEVGLVTNRICGLKERVAEIQMNHSLSLDDALLNNIFIGPAYLSKREVYSRVGEFDTDCIIEDWDFNLRCLEKGIKFDYLSDVIANYRHHESNSFKRVSYIFAGELNILSKYKHVKTYKRAVYLSLRKALSNAIKYNNYQAFFAIPAIFIKSICLSRWKNEYV